MSLQKIYDIYTHEVVGGELLLRVFDEEILDNGIYFPEAFSDNRFNNLTLDILFKLKKYLVTSPEIFPNHVSFNFVPINIESIEIHKSLVEITEMFNRLNKNLVLEISEIFTQSDYIKFLPIAENLKDAGAQIGLDDYGATDIEIDALDFFPLDFVKLDRSISISEEALKSSFHRKMISIANKRSLTLIA
ncbi:EAL domain-containing protein, partial [Candidatus Micropelagos thuwalensis]